jgi:AraC-like DNA-binding protein
MDQRSTVPYVSMKGLSAKAIHQELVQTLGAEAVAYPAVTWHLRTAKFPAQSKEVPRKAGVSWTDAVDAAILMALTNNPFYSVRDLSRLTHLSRSTVHRRLTEVLGFAICHLHWIPHRLPDDQKTIKVNLSREFLRVLQRQ